MGSNPVPIPSLPPSPVRLAILETDTPVPGVAEKYGSYGGVFKYLFERACAELGQPLESQLQLSYHHVVDDRKDQSPDPYPNDEEIDAVLLTGSKHSAWDTKVDWINKLSDRTRRWFDDGRIRVIGVCFGHQIVGRALGGRVDVNPNGWELSVVDLELDAKGKEVFSGLGSLRIQQMHHDVVLEIPVHPNPEIKIENLAKTNRCATQGLYTEGRMISVQGHPEFTGEMVDEILKMRKDQGILTKEEYDDAKARAHKPHDGVVIGKKFLEFLRG